MSVLWSPLQQSPGNSASAMWLMMDGSVLANLSGVTQLMALRPDKQGSYANGSWSPAGNLLLQKWAFSSAVLSDGRLFTCGGEYSGPGLPQTETNFCEVYDPRTQVSTQIAPPPNWTNIGDGPAAVLNDGTFLLGNTQGKGNQVALLNPSTLTWTFGGGDSDNEQGYTLLQTGDVLTTGVYNQTSKRYTSSANAFVPDAKLPVMLGANSETGPGITLMDGRVMWFGASGHTCIYTPGAKGHHGSWVQGPDMPTMPNGDLLAAADVPAILEPNGNVFVLASGPNTPPTFLEYNPALNNFAIPPGAPDGGDRESCRMLLLPNGHGLVSISTGAWYDVAFGPGGNASWAPTITSFPAAVSVNSTVTLAGTQLCGLSECQSYGDDNQQAENYPVVRFIDSLGQVSYARAHDVSTRSIAPGQPGSVLVDIPASLAPGTYSVQVVAMGTPSPSAIVDVVADILQLFYRGANNGVYSRLRNPDGSWSSEQSLGGVLNGDPIAVQIPGTNILQLFYRGANNGVYSRWRNADGSWSGEQSLGGVLNGDPIAVQVPGTNTLQLFYRGGDNGVYSRWRNADGSWSSEQDLGGVLNGDPCAVQVPGTNTLQLFYRGANNGVYSRWRNADGSWSSEQSLGGVLNGDPIVAQVPGTNTLQLFYRGANNGVYSRWRNADGSWSSEQSLGGVLNGDPAVAQIPGTNVLQLFYRGANNGVYSRWRNADGSWSSEQSLGGVLNGDPFAAGVRV